MNEDINSMDFKETFYYLQTFLDSIGETDEEGNDVYEELPETYDKARFGINTKFDAYDYLNKVMIIKPKVGKVLYRGKTINLTDLWTELEERTIIMKQWIKANLPDPINIGAYKR